MRFFQEAFGFVEWDAYEPPEAQAWFQKLLSDYKKDSGHGIIPLPAEAFPVPGAHGWLNEVKKQIYVEIGAVQGTIAEELYHYQQLKKLGYLGKLAPQSVVDQIEHEMIPVLKSKGYRTLEDIRHGKYRNDNSGNR
jgi:hypothetical protein